MRIIAGQYKGRRLQAPKGQTTRPTTDRVRESLMSALASARGGFDHAVVLDAFAGSGALGLEALSRGASRVLFCECDKGAQRVIRANAQALGVSCEGPRANVGLFAKDVLAAPPVWARPPFDVVFLDPPYAFSPASILEFVCTLAKAGALASEVVVAYEHDASSNDDDDACIGSYGLECLSRRKYGDTVIDFLGLSD